VTADRHAGDVDERVQDVRKHFAQYWKSLN
jgi:hypothetical protein